MSCPSLRRSATSAGDACQRRGKGLDRANLRADVHADAGRVQPLQRRRLAIDRPRQADVDAELVFAQAGGDVWMRVGKDVRIHPQRKSRADAQQLGTRGQQRQFCL